MNPGKIFFTFCVLLVGVLNAKSQDRDSILPDFKFYKLEDASAFTKDNVVPGKKSIIILFDTSCSHCQNEIESIGKRYNELKDLNFYLVSMDTKSSIEGFMRTYGKELADKKNVTVLQDLNNNFVPSFKPTQFPALYIYSERRSLLQYFGGQKKVEDILAVVSPAK